MDCSNCTIPMQYDGGQAYMFGGTIDVYHCVMCGITVRLLPPPDQHTTTNPFEVGAKGSKGGEWVPYDDWSEELINAGLI